MGNDILDRVLTTDFTGVINILGILKIPLLLVLIGALFYALMLSLKIRILRDTIELEGSGKIRILVYINLLLSLFITIIGTIIIVLG